MMMRTNHGFFRLAKVGVITDLNRVFGIIGNEIAIFVFGPHRVKRHIPVRHRVRILRHDRADQRLIGVRFQNRFDLVFTPARKDRAFFLKVGRVRNREYVSFLIIGGWRDMARALPVAGIRHQIFFFVIRHFVAIQIDGPHGVDVIACPFHFHFGKDFRLERVVFLLRFDVGRERPRTPADKHRVVFLEGVRFYLAGNFFAMGNEGSPNRIRRRGKLGVGANHMVVRTNHIQIFIVVGVVAYMYRIVGVIRFPVGVGVFGPNRVKRHRLGGHLVLVCRNNGFDRFRICVFIQNSGYLPDAPARKNRVLFCQIRAVTHWKFFPCLVCGFLRRRSMAAI